MTADDASGARAWRAVGLALLVGGCLAAALVAAQVVRHAADLEQVNHVSGARLALVQALHLDGMLYLPLHDAASGRYGGTRTMPLGLLLHAGVVGLGGGLVVSGKLLSAAGVALLVALMLAAMRRRACPWPLAVGLVGAFLVSQCVLRETLSIRGDALSVSLQFAALLVFERRATRAGSLVAGVLCALALFTKLSAVWAVGAAGLHALLARRRLDGGLVAGWLLGVVVLGAVVEVVSDGRFLETFAACGFAGLADGAPGEAAPVRLARMLPVRATPLLPVLVLALAAGLSGLWRRRADLWQVACGLALLVLLVVLGDSGADYNHLLDVLALAVVVVGRAAAAWSREGPWRRGAVGLALVVGLALGLEDHLRRGLTPVRGSASAPRGGLSALTAATGVSPSAPMAAFVAADARLLSEDPTVPLALGRRPVLGDPWMLPRLAASRPELLEPLLARIARREFDVVVLFEPLLARDGGVTPDGQPALADWYRHVHLGPAVAGALAQHYERRGRALGFEIYEPAAP